MSLTDAPRSAAAGLSDEDAELAATLLQLQESGRVDWTRVNDARSHRLHGLFQYPAMMVPQMQHDILELMRSEFDSPSVWDPFVGSGTTLAESMNLGLDFVGRDINPLAMLICRVKAGPYHVTAFAASADRVLASSSLARGRRIEASFPNWDKWFRRDVAVGLSRLRRAIRAEPNPASRRFHWLALAETVRTCSNSRLSTVKLHIRPADEIKERRIDVWATYRDILLRNLERLSEQRDALAEAGLLRCGHYTREITLELGDVLDDKITGPACQIGLTSPPYGDNTSTVTYGQQAYLPLQWIDLEDIHPTATPAVLANTYALDGKSLGGSKRLKGDEVNLLSRASPALNATFKRLRHLPRDRTSRVAAFFRDFAAALPNVLDRLESGSVMVWTVGNRQVGGAPIPLDQALIELLQHHDVRPICRLEREIPHSRKRMAKKNDRTDTIGRESVLVFRVS